MPTVVEIILNYLFIQSSILLFALPFYWAFKKGAFPNEPVKILLDNDHIEQFLSSKATNLMVFLWAAAEAIFWYIIPEFLLLLIVFLRVKRKVSLLVYDILGTVFGTIVGLTVVRFANFNVAHVPYITQNMVEQVRAWYQAAGVLALIMQPFSGVPYKVFVFNAHFLSVNPLLFILFAVAVRIARYYIFYVIFTGLYPFLHRLISRNYLPILLISCFVFSTLFLKVYHSYGHGYTVNVLDLQTIIDHFAALRLR